MAHAAMPIARVRPLLLLGALAQGACGASGEQADAPPSPAAAALLGAVRCGAPELAQAGGLRGDGLQLGEPGPLRVRAPERGDGEVEIAARGVEVGVRLRGASAARGERVDGHAVYADEGGGGAVLRARGPGVEDYVRLVRRPAGGERLDYELRLGAGARALRQIGGRVEVLDGAGVPRLRVDVPYTIDADGERRPAALSVRGCAVDTDPAAPWGRPVVEPGASRCELTVRWSGGRYPLVVDPAWKTTDAMAEVRQHHSAALLDTGDVLVAGGTVEPTTELYHPPAPGDTVSLGAFALTGPLPEGDIKDAPLGAFAGGAVLHGGRTIDSDVEARCWLYATDKGTWRAGPNFSPPLYEHVLVPLDDGRLLAAGGSKVTAFGDVEASDVTAIYDPKTGANGSWKLRAPTLERRKESAFAVLAGGRVLAAGGQDGSSLLASTEVYDVDADSWTPGPKLSLARRHLTATALPDGRALVAGGSTSGDLFTARVEAVDVDKDSTQVLAPLIAARGQQKAVRIGDGRVLLVGGSGFVTWMPSAELYDPTVAGDPPGESQNFVLQPRRYHTVTWIEGSRVLVTGGDTNYASQSSAELFQLYDQGAPCTEDEECRSRHCVDGVCCQEACGGECEACSKQARGTDEPDGVCAARSGGSMPRVVDKPVCVDDTAVNPCSTTGLCNGQARSGVEACQVRPLNQRCSPQICQGPAYTFSVCDGKGACVVTSCSPYARCDGPDACAASCLVSDDCVAGYYCTAAGACAPKLAASAACDPLRKGDECGSGFCVDGVCCDKPCEGLCLGCSAKAKGQGDDGVCGPIAADAPPPGDCDKEEPLTCGRTGACDGKGACAYYGPETACSAADECEVDEGGSAAVFAFRCQSAACVPQQVASCGLYVCGSGSACATSCGGDGDCVGSAYCDASGACQPRRADGAACASGAECGSGQCADGVCCNTACEGQCEACALPGSEGTCVALTGQPAKGRAPCPGASSGVCGARRCDGVERQSCEGFVADEQECAPQRCKEGSAALLLRATCAGNGVCRPQQELPCAPYTCRDGACLGACASDDDCATGTRCEAGLCVAAARCSDATHLQQADGVERACAPFRCDPAGRACLERCETTADCAQGNVCDGAGRCALPRYAEPADDGGCSAAPRRLGAPGGAALLFALLGAALASRRRSHGANMPRRTHT